MTIARISPRTGPMSNTNVEAKFITAILTKHKAGPCLLNWLVLLHAGQFLLGTAHQAILYH